MKQKLLLIFAVVLMIACNIPSLATPAPQIAPPVPVPTGTFDTGGTVTLNNVSFTLPLGVAQDSQSEMASAVTDPNAAAWELTPAYLKFTLTGYQLQNKFHEPQIFVYPAEEYAQLNPSAAEQITRLKNVLASSNLSKDAMPIVPSFNAAPLLASQMQLLDFKNGRGVRMVTQYAQYPAPINNRELFYHFQGLTSDERYYIIAILPVASSLLAEDEKPESPVPAGGVPVPTDSAPGEAYYSEVTKVLDSMYPDSFNPSLFQLDALMQSITVTSQ